MKRRATRKSAGQQGTFMEGFIDDYGRVRLFIALASLGLLAVLFVVNPSSLGGAGIYVLGLLVMALHAGWNLHQGTRAPRLALSLDMAVFGIANGFAVVPLVLTALTFVMWSILVTFLTSGRSRNLLYAYASGWYLLSISQAPTPQDISITVTVYFTVAVIVWIVSAVARRMQTLEMQRSQMLASVSHELRNQLTGVIGMIDLTLDEGSQHLVGESREMIGLARREAVDATDIIEDLLTTSRMESNGLEMSVELVDIAAEVAKIVDHYPAQGASVQQNGVRSSLLAMADPVRLRQIFRNLLTNAVRYGGTTIEVTVVEIGPAVHVLVADDGPGVPTGEGESIFLPYRRATTSRRHKGSVGLGLWISRRLARAMGGDLVYRRESERTIFDLRVPSYLPAPTPPTLIKSA